jgi:hypothetical protein
MWRSHIALCALRYRKKHVHTEDSRNSPRHPGKQTLAPMAPKENAPLLFEQGGKLVQRYQSVTITPEAAFNAGRGRGRGQAAAAAAANSDNDMEDAQT